MAEKAANIVWHAGSVERAERERVMNQQGCVLWFTGLSGSGKSTVARFVEAELIRRGQAAYVLDGDNVRHGLNADLDFSPDSRVENIRRLGEVAALFADAGMITLTAFISPYRADRQRARDIITGVTNNAPDKGHPFIEVFVDTPIEVCEQRDPKGLYQKARAGEIPDFTGIGAPYEAPTTPDITVDTSHADSQACALQIVAVIERNGLIPSAI